MKSVSFSLRGRNSKNLLLIVDGKRVKTKRNQYGVELANIQTEKSTINVKVQSCLQLQNPLWFLVNMFFYIISFFGLFDVRPSKDFTVVDFDATFDLTEENNTIDLTFDSKLDKEAKIDSPCKYEQKTNKVEFDNQLRKRKKILTISKVLTFLIAVVITVIILINKY